MYPNREVTVLSGNNYVQIYNSAHSNDNKFVTTHYMLIKFSDLWPIPTYSSH